MKQRSASTVPARLLLRKWLDQAGIFQSHFAAGIRVNKGTMSSYMSGRLKPGSAVRIRIERKTAGAVPRFVPWFSNRELRVLNALKSEAA